MIIGNIARRKGEVIMVKDSHKGGVVIKKNVDERNKAEYEAMLVKQNGKTK